MTWTAWDHIVPGTGWWMSRLSVYPRIRLWNGTEYQRSSHPTIAVAPGSPQEVWVASTTLCLLWPVGSISPAPPQEEGGLWKEKHHWSLLTAKQNTRLERRCFHLVVIRHNHTSQLQAITAFFLFLRNIIKFLNKVYFFYLSIDLSVSLFLSICPSIYPSVCLSIALSVCLFIYLPVCFYICLSIYMSVHLSFCHLNKIL